MSFLWPQSLLLLLLVPAIVAGYRRALKRTDSASARHVPPALFAIAMVLLLIATARPTVLMVMPTEARTVILAIDISGSMRADDVAPTRLAAAQAAARDFVRTLPASVRVGVVAFSDAARLVQAPVERHEEALHAIATLQPQDGTAVGRGILASLGAIFPQERFGSKRTVEAVAVAAALRLFRAEPASAVILLTDGQNSRGPDPAAMAHLAAGRGVRIYTVGVGTAYGQIGDGHGGRMTVGIDEDSLKGIAAATGGEYFHANSARDLREIYARLGAKVVLQRTWTEITSLLCAVAALAATVSAAMSLLWFGRVL